MKTHILFVCSANIDRSPTAEKIVNSDPKWKEKYEAKSCGTFAYATIPISNQAVGWAEKILVMEEEHYEIVKRKFPGRESKMIVLNVSNSFIRHDPLLRQLLEREIGKWLK